MIDDVWVGAMLCTGIKRVLQRVLRKMNFELYSKEDRLRTYWPFYGIPRFVIPLPFAQQICLVFYVNTEDKLEVLPLSTYIYYVLLWCCHHSLHWEPCKQPHSLGRSSPSLLNWRELEATPSIDDKKGPPYINS